MAKYRLKGLINGSSGIYYANPHGWIGLEVCVEWPLKENESIEQVYLKEAQKNWTYFKILSTRDVAFTNELCEKDEDLQSNLKINPDFL